MARPNQNQTRKRRRALQRASRSRPEPEISQAAPLDKHGTLPAVFDATIPDHFALAAALELLEKRYGPCHSYFPSQVRNELRRATAVLPPLQDALRAPWLLDHEVTVGDLAVIEEMREDAFGERDPERGLGECVVIHMAQQLGCRAGIEDTVARRMAKRRDIKVFSALQVLQALHRYCGLTKGEAWNLYKRLLDGTGRQGTRLSSLEEMGRTKLEKYVGNVDESYA